MMQSCAHCCDAARKTEMKQTLRGERSRSAGREWTHTARSGSPRRQAEGFHLQVGLSAGRGGSND